MRANLICGVLASLALAGSGPAHSQPANAAGAPPGGGSANLSPAAAAVDLTCLAKSPTIEFGRKVDDALVETDPRLVNGANFKVYEIAVAKGASVLVRLNFSGKLLPSVSVGRCRGVAYQTTRITQRSNSQAGHLTLGWTSFESGVYRLRVATRNSQYGALSLTANTIQLPEAPAIKPASRTGAFHGALDEHSPHSLVGEWPYDLLRIGKGAGRRLIVTVKSKGFSPDLTVGTLSGVPWSDFLSTEPTTLMDADGTSAKIFFSNRKPDEDLILRVSSNDQHGGDYDVVVSDAPPPPPPPAPIALGRGSKMTSTLSANDAVITEYDSNDDAPRDTLQAYKLFALYGRRGETFTITLKSKVFDAKLAIVEKTILDEEFAVVRENDDHTEQDPALGDYDSRLTVKLKQSGLLLIRATTVGDMDYGAFEISVK